MASASTAPASITFVVDVTAESGKPFIATVNGVRDDTGNVNKEQDELKNAFETVSKFPPATAGTGGSSRGGKSRRNRKSRGGKSRKGRKSLRRR
jgi:hypothetical protein